MKINNNVSFGNAAMVKFPKSYVVNGLQELDARHFVTQIKKVLPEEGAMVFQHPENKRVLLVANEGERGILESLKTAWYDATQFTFTPKDEIISDAKGSFTRMFDQVVEQDSTPKLEYII